MASECDEVRDVLLDYIRGILDDETTKKVSSHMKACENCRSEVEELKEMHHFLNLLPLRELQAPEEHVKAIMGIARRELSISWEQKPMPEKTAPGMGRLIEYIRGLLTVRWAPMAVVAALFAIVVFSGPIRELLLPHHPVPFKAVQRIDWPLDQRGTGFGFGGEPSGVDKKDQIGFRTVLPPAELRELNGSIRLKEVVKLLKTASSGVTQTPDADKEKAARMIEDIIQRIEGGSIKEENMSVLAEQRLLDAIEAGTEKETRVRASIKTTAGSLSMEFGLDRP